MAKKEAPEELVHLNMKVKRELRDRLDHTADLLGQDRTNLARRIIIENLRKYEEEALKTLPDHDR